MGFLNSFFWLVYGLALMDIVIFAPNFAGFILSIVQIVLCFVFSSETSEDEEMSEQLVDSNSVTSETGSNGNEDIQGLEIL